MPKVISEKAEPIINILQTAINIDSKLSIQNKVNVVPAKHE